MKELVIFDLDKVIVDGQSQNIFLVYLFKKRLVGFYFFAKVSCWFLLYKLALIKNPRKIMDYAFSALRGMSVEETEKIINNFFETTLKKFIFKEAVDIIKEHKAENREIVIVSNAADLIVKKIAHFLGVQHYIATILQTDDGKFTGKIEGKIVYGENKADEIKKFIAEHNFNLEGSHSYSDHISDLPVLEIAEVPVAVNPDKFLEKVAREKNWQILTFNKFL